MIYYHVFVSELALWERRWADADKAIREGVSRVRSCDTAQIRVWLCTKGLRAQAELAALARARRDADAVRHWLAQARKLIAVARRAAAEALRSRRTPWAGWLWPRLNTRVRAAAHGPSCGQKPQQLGIGSNARPSRPTAAGVRPRRSPRLAPPHRGGCAAPRGPRCRGPDRSKAPAPRARTARPTRAARSRAAGGPVTRSTAGSGQSSRPDTSRGGRF